MGDGSNAIEMLQAARERQLKAAGSGGGGERNQVVELIDTLR